MVLLKGGIGHFKAVLSRSKTLLDIWFGAFCELLGRLGEAITHLMELLRTGEASQWLAGLFPDNSQMPGGTAISQAGRGYDQASVPISLYSVVGDRNNRAAQHLRHRKRFPVVKWKKSVFFLWSLGKPLIHFGQRVGRYQRMLSRGTKVISTCNL